MKTFKQKRNDFEMITRTIAFEVKVLSATDFYPTRIKIIDIARNKSKIVSVDYEFNSFVEQVYFLLIERGFNVISKIPACKTGNDLLVCSWSDIKL